MQRALASEDKRSIAYHQRGIGCRRGLEVSELDVVADAQVGRDARVENRRTWRQSRSERQQRIYCDAGNAFYCQVVAGLPRPINSPRNVSEKHVADAVECVLAAAYFVVDLQQGGEETRRAVAAARRLNDDLA